MRVQVALFNLTVTTRIAFERFLKEELLLLMSKFVIKTDLLRNSLSNTAVKNFEMVYRMPLITCNAS
jgi:hypothetical protein